MSTENKEDNTADGPVHYETIIAHNVTTIQRVERERNVAEAEKHQRVKKVLEGMYSSTNPKLANRTN